MSELILVLITTIFTACTEVHEINKTQQETQRSLKCANLDLDAINCVTEFSKLKLKTQRTLICIHLGYLNGICNLTTRDVEGYLDYICPGSEQCMECKR